MWNGSGNFSFCIYFESFCVDLNWIKILEFLIFFFVKLGLFLLYLFFNYFNFYLYVIELMRERWGEGEKERGKIYVCVLYMFVYMYIWLYVVYIFRDYRRMVDVFIRFYFI